MQTTSNLLFREFQGDYILLALFAPFVRCFVIFSSLGDAPNSRIIKTRCKLHHDTPQQRNVFPFFLSFLVFFSSVYSSRREKNLI